MEQGGHIDLENKISFSFPTMKHVLFPPLHLLLEDLSIKPSILHKLPNNTHQLPHPRPHSIRKMQPQQLPLPHTPRIRSTPLNISQRIILAIPPPLLTIPQGPHFLTLASRQLSQEREKGSARFFGGLQGHGHDAVGEGCEAGRWRVAG